VIRILVVTAVEAERSAIDARVPAGATTADDGGSPLSVRVGGVGPVAAAAAPAPHLAAGRNGAAGGYDLVLSAGIAGGFAPLVPGDIAVASSIVFADLGADTADGFAPVSTLGFGRERYDVDSRLAIGLAELTGGHLGTVLTVATVTGTAATAAELAGRCPDAIAEAMEGAGVAAAASYHGVPFAEIRAISNLVGPRDRDAWRIDDALDALAAAIGAVAAGWTP
jgi:futalosine hydrolase